MGFGRKTLLYLALPVAYLAFLGKSTFMAPGVVAQNAYVYMLLPLVFHFWYIAAMRRDIVRQQKPYTWLLAVLVTGPPGAVLYYVFIRDSQGKFSGL